MVNRYRALCHLCGSRVPPGGGTIEVSPYYRGRKWVTFCGGCAIATMPQTLIDRWREREEREEGKTTSS